MKEADRYMKILLATFWEKISFGAIDLFRPFFTVLLDVVEIESGYCYYWILSQDMIFFLITTGFLKLVSTIFYQIFIFSPNDSPLETMKNVFYLIWEALFVLEIFKFL